MTTGWMPHGACFNWQPAILWIRAVSDLVIFGSYMAIPLAIRRFAGVRDDLIFRPFGPLFMTFILLCGLTHAMDVLTLWFPIYDLDALIRIVCAALSGGTTWVLFVTLPVARHRAGLE